MKNILFALAGVTIISMVSCGGPTDAEKKQMTEDSLKAAQMLDSLFNKATDAMKMEDTTTTAPQDTTQK